MAPPASIGVALSVVCERTTYAALMASVVTIAVANSSHTLWQPLFGRRQGEVEFGFPRGLMPALPFNEGDETDRVFRQVNRKDEKQHWKS